MGKTSGGIVPRQEPAQLPEPSVTPPLAAVDPESAAAVVLSMLPVVVRLPDPNVTPPSICGVGGDVSPVGDSPEQAPITTVSASAIATPVYRPGH